MLANLTAGMGPVSSVLEVATQCTLMSLLRFISLFYLWSFDGNVSGCKRKREKAKVKSQ